MKYKELIASSSSAFGVGQYAEALEFAKVAIKLNEKEAEAYSWAGKACMTSGTVLADILSFMRYTS